MPDNSTLDRVIDIFTKVVTSPAAPALVAAVMGHFVIDLLKDWRDAKGKAALRPSAVRALSVVVTQLIFVAAWSGVVFSRGGKWGELDFLYGLAGSLGSILWHHLNPWKEKEPPEPPAPDDGGAPVG